MKERIYTAALTLCTDAWAWIKSTTGFLWLLSAAIALFAGFPWSLTDSWLAWPYTALLVLVTPLFLVSWLAGDERNETILMGLMGGFVAGFIGLYFMWHSREANERREHADIDRACRCYEDESECLVGEDEAGALALSLWDSNRNGRITCAEARAHGIAPVPRGHPAYRHMRDGDGDGVVCE